MPDTRIHSGQLQVLLLSNGREGTYEELRSRLRGEGLSSVSLPVADYTLRVVAVSGVGSAIVDLQGMTEGQEEIAQSIVRRLAADQVPVTVLHSRGQSHNLIGSLNLCADDLSTDVLTGIVLAQMAARQADLVRRQTIRQAESNLTEQLKMAGHVQRDFLPARLPDSPNYRWATLFRPAEWVSGDIYDITRLDEEHVGFYLADAVGHSMPAALLTMFLKHAIVMRETKGNTYRIFEPSEVISRLNVLMAQQGLSGCQFATICYCLLNTRTRQLKFARAGHPYPILVSADGRMRTLDTRGPLLGIFEDSVFQQGSVCLEQGDKLVLYSDGAEGLVGTTDQNGILNFDPLMKNICALPVSQMMTELDKAAQNHEFADGLADDVTAIAVEVLGDGQKLSELPAG